MKPAMTLAVLCVAMSLGCREDKPRPCGGDATVCDAGGGDARAHDGAPADAKLADGVNCANVGCAPPPLCSTGCDAPCGCCPCGEGQINGSLFCEGGCFKPLACPADPPQAGNGCSLTAGTCRYLACSSRGRIEATCDGGRWKVAETACEAFPCGRNPGSDCQGDEVCHEMVGGADLFYCLANGCKAGPLGCACACPGADRCAESEGRFDCVTNTCPSGHLCP